MSFTAKSWIAVALVGLAAVMAGCGGGAASSGVNSGGGGGGNGGGGTGGGTAACTGVSLGQGASLNGFRPFTSASLWNTNISGAAVDPNSASIINFIGASTGLHADFGSGQYQGSNIGIPYVVVSGTQTLADVNFTAYGDESDPGPYFIPPDAPIDNATLADAEEHMLRCLGAAVIMQWNTIPAKLQRELFDSAGSMGDLPRTAELRGRLARFLHNHKDDQ